ncbi:hypothetical protein G6L37_03515 [Agrobacterium rubi]|nr:hypothetical protein [Agrobacterium rubi]NTF24440.1 hypothetical protein [Agrobacterium rubi]
MKRSFLAMMFSVVAATTSSARDEARSADALIRDLLSIKSVQYRFVQFGPKGDQTSGIVRVQRPGRVRFEYDAPSPLEVVADGRSLGVHNRAIR